MYRNTPLIIAFSVALASPAAYALEQSTQTPQAKSAKANKRADTPHLAHAANGHDKAVAIKANHREVIAMAPTGTEIDGWGVRLAAASPSDGTQELLRQEQESEGGNINVLGMLAAALGLGVMSIVRRMGRF